ncbi:hypothetical protein ACC689_29050 [Rhizobium ruizarguesonis]
MLRTSRRSFLSQTATLFFAVSTKPTLVFGETAPSNIRIPLSAMAASAAIQGASFDRKFQAALFAVASAGGGSTSEQIVQTAANIADGSKLLEGESNFISNLVREIARHAQASVAFALATPDTATGLEGYVSASANSALWLAAAAAPSITADPDAKAIPRTLTSDANGKALMLVLAAAAGEELGPVIHDARFQSVAPFPENPSVDELVSTLPPVARQFATQIKDMLSPVQRNDVELLLSQNFEQALAEAATGFSSLTAQIKDGANLFDLKRDGLVNSAQSDMKSVAAIGAFVVGEVFGDKETAEKINAGAQLASAALQIGLMFSTGGLSAIACAGGIASSLGPLFVGGQSESVAVQGMLSKISDQIETLRKEMNARFDRVERLQREALDLLRTIQEDLREGNIAVIGHLQSLKWEVTQLSHYLRNQAREDKLHEFNNLCSDAQSAKEHHNVDNASNAMSHLLNYAIDIPRHQSFNYASFATIAGALEDSRRTDLCVGLLPRCKTILGLENPGITPPNPVEWARAVNAYLETQAHFPEVQEAGIQSRARSAWRMGMDIRKYFRDNITKVQLEDAVDKYVRCGELVADKVEQLIQAQWPFDQRGPRVGPYLFPSLLNAKQLSVEEATSQAGVKYIIGGLRTDENYADLKILNIEDGDPLQWAVDTERIRLETIDSRQLTFNSAPAGGFGGSVGSIIRFKVFNKKDERLNDISKVIYNWTIVWTDIGVQPRFLPILPKIGSFEAWLFGSQEKILNFWRAMAQDLDESAALNSWINNVVDPLEEIDESTNYNEVAAALMSLSSALTWRVTDQLDDPWNGAVATLIPRNLKEIRNLLSNLLQGVFERDQILLPSTLPMVVLAEAGGNPRLALDHLWSRRRDPESPGSAFAEWIEINPTFQVEFRILATTMIRNWVNQARLHPDTISRHIDKDVGIPLVDRTLSKMDALRSLSTN